MKNRTWVGPIVFLALSVVLLLLVSRTIRRPPIKETALSVADAAVSVEDLQALYTGTAEPLDAAQQALYDSTVKVLLKENLWTERDMYDAGNYLMIPMHYAFRAGDEDAIALFADFFKRFTNDVSETDIYGFRDTSALNQFQFLYLCTQYICLCTANGYNALIPELLPSLVETYAQTYLYDGTLYSEKGRTPVIDHIRYVLDGGRYDKNYYGAIYDSEKFTLALLCDLNYVARIHGETPDEVTVIAADLACQLFSSPYLNQITEKEGWLFQVGAWADHPDYAYAGNETITKNMQMKPKENIAEDSSHSHRIPLFLRSYQSAQRDIERWERMSLRRKQLANQMICYVLKNVDGHWLTTTFMDGTNGVYRYSYHEDGVGLEGYALSGTFLLGWWSLLEDSRITAVYQDILKTFPMKGDRSNPYFDYATVRERNPFFSGDTAFDNGMMECMVACASKISPTA